MAGPDDAKYSVFVSYRRLPEDTRWAEWLVETLADFAPPEPLRKKGVPDHVGHIFRGDNEMSASSDLSSDLKAALWNSSHLIVVCSPNTPKSDWVGKDSSGRPCARRTKILSLKSYSVMFGKRGSKKGEAGQLPTQVKDIGNDPGMLEIGNGHMSEERIPDRPPPCGIAEVRSAKFAKDFVPTNCRMTSIRAFPVLKKCNLGTHEAQWVLFTRLATRGSIGTLQSRRFRFWI